MKFGILCAGDSELEPFLPLLEGRSVRERAMLRIYEGSIEGVPAAALFSGVCKVNAAIAAQILIGECHCGAVLNAGTAGAMDGRLEILDTVVSTETAYHDVAEDLLTEFHPWLPSVWFPADPGLTALAREAAAQLAPRRVFFGRMVTGEQFIEDAERERIWRQYAPLSVDMETAAAAHVCHVNGIPFLAVRTITDTPAQRGPEVFEAHCEEASRRSAAFVRQMLRAAGGGAAGGGLPVLCRQEEMRDADF